MKGIYQFGEEFVAHDPGPEMIPFFTRLDPDYRVDSVRPGAGFISKLRGLRQEAVYAPRDLLDLGVEELLSCLRQEQSATLEGGAFQSGFSVLQAAGLKSAQGCRLCGHRCGVNRYAEAGRCGLREKAVHNEPFIHVAEEFVINPAIVTNFGGCALRCRYCIEAALWDVARISPSEAGSFWESVASLMHQGVPINALEFTNPTESLAGLLSILSEAPEDFNLPLVANCHLYGTKLFYDLAGWITDVWLSDLRYGNDACARSLSGVEDYMEYARVGLDAMTALDARVIVRVLVLPGHGSCCHEPALELLAEYGDRVWVSVLDQYVPEHEAPLVPGLGRRPTREEIEGVQALVARYGLRDVNSGGESFWLEHQVS
jgi:putative pyruvate formate lyase activating enzyme